MSARNNANNASVRNRGLTRAKAADPRDKWQPLRRWRSGRIMILTHCRVTPWCVPEESGRPKKPMKQRPTAAVTGRKEGDYDTGKMYFRRDGIYRDRAFKLAHSRLGNNQHWDYYIWKLWKSKERYHRLPEKNLRIKAWRHAWRAAQK